MRLLNGLLRYSNSQARHKNVRDKLAINNQFILGQEPGTYRNYSVPLWTAVPESCEGTLTLTRM